MTNCINWNTIVLALALFGSTAVGQPISIIKVNQEHFSLRATAPQGDRYALQVSKDLKLWLNINDSVFGTVSNQVGQASAAGRYFRLVSWVDPKPIRIALLGDSTVADFASNQERFYGWGQGMYDYFNSFAQIANLAWPGIGTKNFLGSELEARMLIIKPDYVLIDLCYEDEFGPPERATTLEQYEQNLRTIIQEIRGFNGTPILVTPQSLYLFNDQDQTGVAYPKRNAVIEKVAADMQVFLLDLSTSSIALLNQLGKAGSQYLYADWLHFSAKGAEVMAGLVVNALPPELGGYLATDKVLMY